MGCAPSADDYQPHSYNHHDSGYPRSYSRDPRPPPRDPRPPPRDPRPPPRDPRPTPTQPTAHSEGDSTNYVRDQITGLHEVQLDFRVRANQRHQWRDPTRQGVLYTDQEFPLHVAIEEYRSSQIEWKRPREFCDYPVLFADGTTRFDIGQGSAGTCWFLSMVANLAENEDFIHRVVPLDAWDPDTGVFKCRFYHFGQWDTIYTDDFLPIVYGTTLWGAKSASDKTEMWVALLEKGFARLHGSYNAIYGGQASDAYLAMTGGVAERVDFDEQRPEPVHLYNRVRNALQTGALVSCTVPEEYDNYAGLVGAHAYSLNGTGMVQTRDGREIRLMRVRNPWGRHEWTGPWSDGSREWDSVVRKTVENPNKDDGEFWISLDDFMTYFSQTTICSLTPDVDSDGRADSLTYVTYIYGEWTGEKAAGFENKLENPRFVFTMPNQGLAGDGYTPVVVQTIQRTKHRKEDRFSIRSDLFKIIGKGGTRQPSYNVEILGDNTSVYTAEIQVSHRHRIHPGDYIIIPSTIRSGEEKEFLIRVFTPCPITDIRELDSGTELRACEEEKYLEYNHHKYPLTRTISLFGEWIVRVNAGGQVSHQNTFASNPQFAFSIRGREEPVVFHVMQDTDHKYPVGIRVFPLKLSPAWLAQS
ncbi:calpain-1 catalytic subunit-like [Gigantopelta aegis]|uniref:calpain-1 catalytic subunit-like n=1 Tax=Gigantopelta aegis TaxID=1735272 RepID=UPI001B889CAA|nr:calpain-1 catalytic subunit-like [Gigantopelta aegis]